MGAFERAKDYLIAGTVRGLLRVAPYVSDERMVSVVRRGIESISYPDGREFVKNMLLVMKRLAPTLSPACRKKAVENFLINACVRGYRLRNEFEEREGARPPMVIVISPTMRCNLRCYGCYAGEYSKKDDLPREVFDRVLSEAKQMGTYFITISGGEPFISQDVLDMFEKHDDMYFQVYTNGTLIDRRMAHRLAELGNVLPAISVEGFEKETDERRGKGTFRKVMDAMDALREEGVLFGFSATATRQNNDLIVSDEFIRFYYEKGCFLGWYFQYIPIGREPATELVPTPEQRMRRLHAIREARRRYRMLLADFWNDGPLTGGCIAAGRYMHVNVHGDVEPCVFAHFAVDNIKEKSLADVVKSDFFRTIRSQQPYVDNLLRPCMIIDVPEVLREAVARCGAHPTHPGAETIITDLAEQVDENARRWAELADAEWECPYYRPYVERTAQPVGS